MEYYSLIMAGGGGTRFWPLSRKNMPKQLLNLSGKDVMINETIDRTRGLIPIENTFIITNGAQTEPMKKVLMKDFHDANILKEPVGRNTAACILYPAMRIMKKYGDGILCVFPADHYIAEKNEFRSILGKAVQAAETQDTIVTIGIAPTFASTGYGYIKVKDKKNIMNNDGSYRIDGFTEKPNAERAREFVESKMYYWNSGIFVFKISSAMKLFQKLLPELFGALQDISENFGTEKEESYIKKVYPTLQSISFDYGIMEKVDGAVVIPGDFGWSDLGSFDSLSAVLPKDEQGNIIKADHIGMETTDTVVYGGKRLIATIGISDTVIVDTDDAVLICKKDQVQTIKLMVEKLSECGKGALT